MAIALTSRATVYDRYAISRKFTAQETAINIVQGSISLFATESEITELKNGNKTMYSRLATVELDLNSITLAVSSSEYQDINGVLSAITQARASITLNTQQILLKVSKDSVISSINQTAESVKIDANKIELTGNGLINILNTGTTTINAPRINLNGVVTANENFKILADGSMVAQNGLFNGNVDISSPDRFTRGVKVRNQNTGESGTLQAGYLGIGGVTTNSNVMYVNIFGGETSSEYGSPFILLYKNGVMSSIYPDKIDMRNGAVWCDSLSVTGSKNRIVKTKSYGVVAQSAYETAEPMFGDMGHGVINEFGECIVFIDPKFSETVSTEYGYYVFISKYSSGDVWISKKDLTTFTVAGTHGLEFDWELKAHQKGYETDRLKTVELPDMNNGE